MGLSTAMKQMIYKTAQERGIQMCYTWVGRENTASVKALEKTGIPLPRGMDGGILRDPARNSREVAIAPIFNPIYY